MCLLESHKIIFGSSEESVGETNGLISKSDGYGGGKCRFHMKLCSKFFRNDIF